jgi:homocysteine S-methyltransferase
MTKIVERYAEFTDRVLFVCDFSPPRGSDPGLLAAAGRLDADFVSLAYNPGKSTRVNSVAAAHWIKTNLDKDVVFTLATRDMNKVAVQSLLLGAELLGLENVVIVRGDALSRRETSLLKPVADYTPTGLLRAVGEMNRGIDFKGLKLRAPTDLCAGATFDLSKGIERELELTRRKVQAGAQFLISQPTFDPSIPRGFIQRYADRYGEELSVPVFHGVQVMVPDSLVFGQVPEWITADLDKGRSGSDMAVQVLREFEEAGFRSIYLVAPVIKGGRRDYDAAQATLEAFRG